MDYDYQKGFEEGYRMIMGASALLPLITFLNNFKREDGINRICSSINSTAGSK